MQLAQVAEVLHKTMEQLAAMQELAGKRQPVLAAVDALDATLAEVAWMRTWKCDANRFSVRLLRKSHLGWPCQAVAAHAASFRVAPETEAERCHLYEITAHATAVL